MGYSRRNPNKWEGLRTWNFQEYWKSTRNSRGELKKKWNLKGCSRKTHLKFPWVLVFDLGIFKDCHTVLHNFQGWQNLKFQGGEGESEKYSLLFGFYPGKAHVRLWTYFFFCRRTMGNFARENFLLNVGNLTRSDFDHSNLFKTLKSKLKTTCKYWTLIKMWISMACVYKV